LSVVGVLYCNESTWPPDFLLILSGFAFRSLWGNRLLPGFYLEVKFHNPPEWELDRSQVPELSHLSDLSTPAGTCWELGMQPNCERDKVEMESISLAASNPDSYLLTEILAAKVDSELRSE
jgi:hypothetical protein